MRLQTHYPAGYPTGKPDSDHLCDVQLTVEQCCHLQLVYIYILYLPNFLNLVYFQNAWYINF